MSELLIGCGNRRDKLVVYPGRPTAFLDLVTLDLDPGCGADVLHDLEQLPLPFADNAFDELHAYHVLEHLGRQGDWRQWFALWSEFYRILKPKGLFCGIVPSLPGPWVWGDPGHTRVITSENFVFLNQPTYRSCVGSTAMSDYRSVWRGDFDTLLASDSGAELHFALKAIKPARLP